MLFRPRLAAWTLAVLTSLGLAGSVYRIAIQVSDSLEVIEHVAPMPSALAAFQDGLTNSTTMLRPLKQVWTKLLVSTGEATGNRFHLVFRGFHALAGTLLVVLVVWVCPVRTWTDVAALACALAILTGMHTFVGLFRESFPINHFLIVAICAMATFALSQSRGGRVVDVAACVIFVLAALTFESGLLVFPVAAAAFIAGSRGISKRSMVAMTVLLLAYAALRVGYLSKQPVTFGERTTGFGVGTLTADEQVVRFGSNPVPFWAYNVSMAATSVLLSQPTIGQWTVARAWQQDAVTPVYHIEIGSSLVTSLFIAWYVFGRSSDTGRRRWREPLPLVFLVVLAANAMLGYAYAKNEIISTAGVFYAVIAYAAFRELLTRQLPRWRAVPIAVLLLAVSCAWATRSAGLHLRLRHGAFEARAGWAFVLSPSARDHWPKDPHTFRVETRMREESILESTIAPALLPKWTEWWWGED
jgi:hypothetical protein